MQEAGDARVDGATSTVPDSEGKLNGTPPATPQQLRAAVAALTDQLDSAKKSLIKCVGAPAAQRQLDASLARYAEPVQAILARQMLTVLGPSHEPAAPQQGAGAASDSMRLLPTAAQDGIDNTPEAAPTPRKPATAELGVPAAEVSKGPPAAASLSGYTTVGKRSAEQPPAEEGAPPRQPSVMATSGQAPAMPDMSAAMTLLQIGRDTGLGCNGDAAEAGTAAYNAEPTAATTETAQGPTSAEHGLDMSEAPDSIRPGAPASPALARAPAGSNDASGEMPVQDSLAPSRLQSSEQGADDAAAAHGPARACAEGAASAAGRTRPNNSSAAAAGAGDAALYKPQNMQQTVQAATLTERDISPDFGEGLQEGEGVQGRVMDAVGKLCRDIDPMQTHASDSEKPQTAKAAWTDPQAATMLAEPAATANPGSQMCSVETLQCPARATDTQQLEHSAHTSISDLTRDLAPAGTRKEGSGTFVPRAADARSTCCAGSWKTCRDEADGLHPGEIADTTLAAISVPGKQRSANEVVQEVPPAGGRSLRPATSAHLGSMHTSLRQAARAAGRAPGRSERAHAERSTGGKPSRVDQAQGQAAAKGAPSKGVARACTASGGGTEMHSGSSAEVRTNVNTPLTPGCIFGCACNFSVHRPVCTVLMRTACARIGVLM